MKHKPPSKRKPETAPVDEKHRATTGPNVGRGDDAGRREGAPDLDADNDHENRHDR